MLASFGFFALGAFLYAKAIDKHYQRVDRVEIVRIAEEPSHGKAQDYIDSLISQDKVPDSVEVYPANFLEEGMSDKTEEYINAVFEQNQSTDN